MSKLTEKYEEHLPEGITEEDLQGVPVKGAGGMIKVGDYHFYRGLAIQKMSYNSYVLEDYRPFTSFSSSWKLREWVDKVFQGQWTNTWVTVYKESLFKQMCSRYGLQVVSQEKVFGHVNYVVSVPIKLIYKVKKDFLESEDLDWGHTGSVVVGEETYKALHNSGFIEPPKSRKKAISFFLKPSQLRSEALSEKL